MLRLCLVQGFEGGVRAGLLVGSSQAVIRPTAKASPQAARYIL